MSEQATTMQKIGDCEEGEVYRRDDGSFVFVDPSGEQREISEIALMLTHFRWSSNFDIRSLEEGEAPEWMDSTRWVLPDDFDGKINQ